MHQQNDHAERFIQTIVEKAQAIRLEACIPQNWWEFAVNYAVHVYNQTPLKRSSNDYKMPFERLHRTKPDVAHLRFFGCGAYVFLPEDVQSNNLSPRSELMIFIGIAEGTKGYIFMRMLSLQLSKHYLTKHCSRNVQLCVVWDIHLWVSLLMTCRVSIMDLQMMRMVIMGVDYHLFQWDQQTVRRHGSLCSHSSHQCFHLLIHLYHLHTLPVVLAVI
jgi:hypothetical protein